MRIVNGNRIQIRCVTVTVDQAAHMKTLLTAASTSVAALGLLSSCGGQGIFLAD
jgi:hypothetical protein